METTERFQKLKELTDLFEANKKQYRSDQYDESNTRTDFIDKFFALLDWDISNNQGFSEVYREVVREDKVKIDGKQKAPDYCFRIGGLRKFFVEAKKPSVNIKDDSDPAFQIRRYAYTAKLPLSILTDFDEFSVYDSRIKPDKNDKASVARIFYCTYEEYEKNFEFIYNTFSKTAILKGSFDKYIEESKNKQGTSEIDKELLKLIESWRIDLAKNIAFRNPNLDLYSLNTAVQKTIDRIVFLRIAEDKEIEEYGALLSFASKSGIYLNLIECFKQANEKYNSGLFCHEDWLSELQIDDKILSKVIKSQYYPECPYEFSVLPIEILGNIYEQFLGKTICFKNIKGGHTIAIEEKPDVRKAGGVYYTPQYIVDFIIHNTVGQKIYNKLPSEVANLKICDPACGSGSFLVGAFQFLLNYHLDYYSTEKQLKNSIKLGYIYQVKDHYRLTIEEKQRILTNNIFGVDIDSQAVEVTKLSLYLKLLEDEGKEAKGSGYLFRHSDLKLLPTLDDNIKCGNSLIESKIYQNKNLALYGIEELRKINAFDWDKEFGNVMLSGGFDCIVGNPPYGAEISDDEKEYLQKRYETYEYQLNTFSFFIELGKRILKNDSLISFITPSVFTNQYYFLNLRSMILKNFSVKLLKILNYKVFNDANTGDTVIFVMGKQDIQEKRNSNICEMQKVKAWDKEIESKTKICQEEFSKNDRKEFLFPTNGLMQKIESSSVKLSTIATCIMGIKPYQVGKGKPKQDKKTVESRVFDSNVKKDDSYKQYIIGKDIDRYSLHPLEKRYLKYGEWLAEPRQTAPFERSKIVIRQTSDIIRACIDDNGYYNLNNIYNLELNDESYSYHYILGILNSKLMVFIYQSFVPEKGRLFAEVKKVNLDKLPIKKIENSNDIECRDRLVDLVKEIIKTKEEINKCQTENSLKMYYQKAEKLEEQINALVYKIYGLSEIEAANINIME